MATYKMTAYIMRWKHSSGGHFPVSDSKVPITVNADSQMSAEEKAKKFLKELPKNDFWKFIVEDIIIE